MTKVNRNNQGTANTINTGNKSRSVENTLLLCLFVIGLLGTIYFLKHSGGEQVSSHEVVYVEAIAN